MARLTLRFVAPVLPLVALSAGACNKDKPTGTTSEPGVAKPVASAAPSAAPEDLRPQDPGAPCVSGERKVWAKWANRRTGITPTQMGDKLALGVAVGNKPKVLVVDKQGAGELVNVAMADGSDLAKDIPKNEGKRDLQRVTPFKASDGKLTAYADYRDKYESKRRRIACELVSTKQVVLAYDDKPLLDDEKKKDDKKDPVKTAAAPDAGAPPVAAAPTPSISTKALKAVSRLNLPGMKGAAGDPSKAAAPAAGDAGAAPPPDTKAEGDKKEEKKKALREVRDCRTFVDDDGEVWALGSELHGQPQDDDSVKWSMRLFVQPNAAGGYYMLDSVALPKEPKELHTWEAPWAAERADGSFVLTARYRGTLVSFLLNKDHKPTGKVKSYRGGWPGNVEIASDGSNRWLLTSFKTAGDSHELRLGKIGEGLPAQLDKPAIDGVDASLSEPSLAIAGGQRWLMMHAGKRKEARLVLVPVDENMKATGKPYDVAATAGGAADSRLIALDGGKLMAVYIQAGKEGDELVSQVLTCSVKS